LSDGPGILAEGVWPLPNQGPGAGAYAPSGVTLDQRPTEDWRVTPSVPAAAANDDQSAYLPRFRKPVVAGDRLFAAIQLKFGTSERPPYAHPVQAYGVDMGDRLWMTLVGNAEERIATRPTRPAVSDGLVYVGAGATLHALNVTDGTTAWTQQFQAEIRAVLPSPDRMYVLTREDLHALAGPDDVAWTAPVQAVQYWHRLALGPRYLYSLYAGESAMQLVALEPTTGAVAWQRTLSTEFTTESRLCAVAGGVLMLPGSGSVLAVTNEGEQAWRASARYRSMATDGNRVYLGTTDGQIRALAVPDGERAWEREYGPNNGISAALAVTDEAVYVPIDASGMAAIHPETGDELWNFVGEAGDLVLGQEQLYKRSEYNNTIGVYR
jgi:outer membrane protein assembly factor BamB